MNVSLFYEDFRLNGVPFPKLLWLVTFLLYLSRNSFLSWKQRWYQLWWCFVSCLHSMKRWVSKLENGNIFEICMNKWSNAVLKLDVSIRIYVTQFLRTLIVFVVVKSNFQLEYRWLRYLIVKYLSTTKMFMLSDLLYKNMTYLKQNSIKTYTMYSENSKSQTPIFRNTLLIRNKYWAHWRIR